MAHFEGPVQCLVVKDADSAHVLEREVVERIARCSHDAQAEFIGSYLHLRGLTLQPNATLSTAAGLMLSHGCKYLPVMDGSMFLG